MAVFRVERNQNYTVMSNYHLRDKSLSLKAKGLLSQILSLPENWDYTLTGLAKINAEGKDAIRAAIAYDLGGERLGLERLKAKFSGPMALGPDARTFALLTSDGATRAPGFRSIAARATKAETLSAFLTEYRKRYPEAAVPDRGVASDGSQSRADAPAASPPG